MFQMTEAEKQATRRTQDASLGRLGGERRPFDLDEACAAWQLGMVDEALLRRAVLEKPEAQEVVLTGRSPAPWMREAADYCTEMRCCRHPFHQGSPPGRVWSTEPAAKKGAKDRHPWLFFSRSYSERRPSGASRPMSRARASSGEAAGPSPVR